MYVLLAEIRAKPGQGDLYAALLDEIVTTLSAEPCFVRFSIHRGADDPDLFLLHEVWSDVGAYTRLREGPAFVDYLARREAIVLSVRRSDWTLTRTVERTRTVS
jgi:quinol monooxygenase YgiN